ncbi:MAG: toll/interleukin-1 receptor domain-containing protein [Acidobacteria bacterium]|nr:toll/interleukin-1 receptor domain-containing protein [Acidobacteriota bacterium]
MQYDYDLFISYAHIDDLNPFGEERGWIDLLHERLSVLLAQALGYEPRIWRDGHRLQGNDELTGAIGAGVTRSLLLVPVLSPRYVQSDWCNREMETFHAAMREQGQLPGSPGFRSRVFKVVKTPIPEHLRECEPVQIRNLIGYQFYGEDESSGVLTEFSPAPNDKQYWRTLSRLVADLKQTLIELKHRTPATPWTPAPATAPPAPAPATPATPTTPTNAPPATNAPAAPEEEAAAAAAPTRFVYLAETTGDLSREREDVRDELRQRGYGVLPEQRLPLDERLKVEEAVRADLARCCLSVHMVGPRYGSTPEDDAASVVQIQERLAAERGAAEGSFQRIVWTPPGLGTPALEITDARQKAFVETLHQSPTAGAEILQATVEDLKTRAVEKLLAMAKAQEAQEAKSAAGAQRKKLKQVYLICENRDRQFVRPIKQYLFKENFEVITWLEGEAGAERLAEYHRKNLRECDAALIYFGSGDEPWVRKNLEDLEKAYGYGREQDWAASAVFVGQPPDDVKEDFLTHMVPYVIHNLSGFNPEDLRDFVQAVREAEGETA